MNITEETIDSFLRGDLSGSELSAFNKAVAADPKLQQEVSIQQDIINSVKQHRHQQLKNRLNAIDIKPVGLGFYYSSYIKLAASIGVVALIVGAFSFFNKGDEKTITTEVSTTATSKQANPEPTIASTQPLTNSKPEIEKQASISKQETLNTSTTTKTSNTKTKSTSENGSTGTTTYPELVDETIEPDNTIDGINDNFNMPTMNHGGNASNVSSPQIKVSIVKENNLGYRFFNNQLYLHGNFSNSTYELFELNNKPSKQLFLYFENNYYELIQGKTKITSLVPITDKATLVQLTQLREH